MLFKGFRRKNLRKSGFPHTLLLSSEHPVPKRSEGKVTESLAGSGKPEFYQAFLSDLIFGIKLKELFKIIGGLTEQRPYPVSLQPVIETSSEAPQIFGDGYEAFCYRACLPAVFKRGTCYNRLHR